MFTVPIWIRTQMGELVALTPDMRVRVFRNLLLNDPNGRLIAFTGEPSAVEIEVLLFRGPMAACESQRDYLFKQLSRGERTADFMAPKPDKDPAMGKSEEPITIPSHERSWAA